MKHTQSEVQVQAVTYSRMSTDLQKYSIENQEEALAEYAKRHGMRVVRHYRDHGKSGLTTRNRAALKQLLVDVQDDSCDFSVVLVYDVSRWGRFQNTDQAAYYDYLCRMNGIEVIYVAEQFGNDGTPFTAILKNLKRAMAGEYSRELSAKVKAGHARLVKLGYAMGGPAPLGLRRLLLNERGEPRMQLQPGERKSIQSDRVVLVPGPPEEVALVRRIFDLYGNRNLALFEIVELLKREGIKSSDNAYYSRGAIRTILSREAYIGNTVWGRRTSYLRGPLVRVRPEEWIRKDSTHEAIIDKALFQRVQRRLAEFVAVPMHREAMLDALRRTLASEGEISLRLAAKHGGSSRHAYDYEFGGFTQACQQIGYQKRPTTRGREVASTKMKNQELIRHLVEELRSRGHVISIAQRGFSLTVDGRWSISVVVSFESRRSRGSQQGWVISSRKGPSDVVIVQRLCSDSETIKDYYVVPKLQQVLFPTVLRAANAPQVEKLRTDQRYLMARVTKALGMKNAHAAPLVGAK